MVEKAAAVENVLVVVEEEKAAVVSIVIVIVADVRLSLLSTKLHSRIKCHVS
ncbi:hypothetical protein D3C76_1811800 [compost metagenome]